jgi:transcriptional regulator with XRE-family HTH domain
MPRSSIPLLWRRLQDIHKVVGKTIRSLRQKNRMTQVVFAERAGLDRTHVYRIESGRQSMTLRTLKTIADTLGVRVRDLVRDI